MIRATLTSQNTQICGSTFLVGLWHQLFFLFWAHLRQVFSGRVCGNTALAVSRRHLSGGSAAAVPYRFAAAFLWKFRSNDFLAGWQRQIFLWGYRRLFSGPGLWRPCVLRRRLPGGFCTPAALTGWRSRARGCLQGGGAGGAEGGCTVHVMVVAADVHGGDARKRWEQWEESHPEFPGRGCGGVRAFVLASLNSLPNQGSSAITCGLLQLATWCKFWGQRLRGPCGAYGGEQCTLAPLPNLTDNDA
eukprot:359185-Chlamydomonas_euryale.AAC.5